MSNSTQFPISCLSSANEAFGPTFQGDGCHHFDFTIAFEQYFFTTAPAAILIIAAPLRLWHTSRLPSLVAGDYFRLVKLGAAVVFSAIQLSLVAVWSSQSHLLGKTRTISLAASCVSLVASLLICGLSYIEHAKSPQPSSILNAYLLVTLLLDAASVRTFWLSDLPKALCILSTASSALKAVLLILEAVEKRHMIRGVGQIGTNPEATSGLYSKGLFWWMNPLLLAGFRDLLRPNDLYTLGEDMSTVVLQEKFWQAWNSVRPSSKHRLLISCIKTLKWHLMAAVVPRLLLLAFTICQPLVLSRFLTFLQTPTDGVSIGYALLGAYGLVYIGIALSTSFYQHQNFRAITMLRGTLVSAIFSRSLKLSTTNIDNSAAVTLMSTDVDTIIRGWRELHELWANIIQIPLVIWLLSTRIGYACVGPVLISGLALTVSVFLSPYSKKFMVAWIVKVQQRIGITSNMLGHMKSIKIAGLSQKLGTSLGQLRKDEIDAAAPFRMLSAVASAIAQVPALLSPVAAFALSTIRFRGTEASLDTTTIFTSLSLIILLGQPLFWILEALLDVTSAIGCFQRIEKFLLMNSRDQNGVTNQHESALPTNSTTHNTELREITPTEKMPGGADISVIGATFSWSAEGPAQLKNVNLNVQSGQLAVVIGAVASGKSALLRGLLGELPWMSGTVDLGSQKVAYCQQNPWLVNDTIMNNIIGYTSYDEKLYRTVVHACDLDRDFAFLENGDKSVIGSKGIVLSGGQKQRVALARAIYSRPRLAFLDDPFSGLDNYTARTVFDRSLNKDAGLLRQWGTTIILVSQTASFLSKADYIIALKDGFIAEQGTYMSLAHSGGYVESFCAEDGVSEENKRIDTVKSYHQEYASSSKKDVEAKSTVTPVDKRRQQGDSSIYMYLFSSVGLYPSLGLLLCEVLWVFFSTFPTVWLNWWTEANTREPNHRIGYYLGIYAGLQVLAVICFGTLMLTGMFFIVSRMGLRMHQRLLDSVMKAPLSLFATTDIGSIITRFSQDIGLLDRSLPLALVVSIANFFTVIGQAGLLAASTGYVAIAFPFLVFFFFFIQRGYLRTSRQLRLLDLEQKAPVYTQFLETLSGLATIRAFGWSSAAMDLNHSLIYKSQQPYYLLLMVQQWLALVLNLVTAALAILVIGLAVRLRDSVSAGLTGVSLIQLITLAETLKLLIQFWTSLETSLGAVARIKNFSEETPNERLPGEDHQPPERWPSHGTIELQAVSASYGNDLAVKALDSITVSIPGGQKVGLVGRTGSGKSTFLLALLRLLPNTLGTIHIDDLDISTLPKEVLRVRIITVSQDTFFLPGTVRLNIDPYETACSDAIEAVLRRVGLWDIVMEKGGLDAKFDESTLSHGQQQLFSLARAVLRKEHSRVVVFDEATSSVDAQTDIMVREFINEEFRAHTVVWIAHRLESIIGFDRVIVLENGCVAEDGNPKELIAVGETKFGELWNARQRETS